MKRIVFNWQMAGNWVGISILAAFASVAVYHFFGIWPTLAGVAVVFWLLTRYPFWSRE
ncbi:MAG: hypothetical protein ABH835_03540 [Patescibacteria group bacterium]